MAETTFIPTQRATQPLEHGRIICETDNANVIRLKKAPYDPNEGTEPPPIIDVVGEGVATYEIKIIYQPLADDFPCLVSNPRFRLQVFWDDDAEQYLARPIDHEEMNKSLEWLRKGVSTMNALHDHFRGHVSGAVGHSTGRSPTKGDPNRIAEIFGSLLGAAGRVFFS